MIQKDEPTVLRITSGRGGVGKTSVAVNLAFTLMNKGCRVLLVDGDLGLANVDILLGITAQTTIRNVLDNGADPLETVVYLEDNLGILPASSGVPKMVNLGRDHQKRLEKVLTFIASHFDYMLLDTAAGIGSSVLWLNIYADHNIIVISSDPTSLTDAYAIIKTLFMKFHRNLFYIVLNFIRNTKESRNTYETLENVVIQFLHLDLRYLGAVPEDRVVKDGVRHQRPFIRRAPQSNAARAVIALVEQIQGLKKRSP